LIIASLKKFLKKVECFIWTNECGTAFDTLKEKIASAPIMVYPDWNKKFHVHIDTSSITLGAIN